jgi:hypothetical protein
VVKVAKTCHQRRRLRWAGHFMLLREQQTGKTEHKQETYISNHWIAPF